MFCENFAALLRLELAHRSLRCHELSTPKGCWTLAARGLQTAHAIHSCRFGFGEMLSLNSSGQESLTLMGRLWFVYLILFIVRLSLSVPLGLEIKTTLKTIGLRLRE